MLLKTINHTNKFWPNFTHTVPLAQESIVKNVWHFRNLKKSYLWTLVYKYVNKSDLVQIWVIVRSTVQPDCFIWYWDFGSQLSHIKFPQLNLKDNGYEKLGCFTGKMLIRKNSLNLFVQYNFSHNKIIELSILWQ